MKTFDLAIEHLEGIDFKQFPITSEGILNFNPAFLGEIMPAQSRFIYDPTNNKSNNSYRIMCFTAATFHQLFKAHGWESPFEVACKIVEKHKEVLDTKFEVYLNTVYPKVMIEEWENYCKELREKTKILDKETDIFLFFVAYHHLIDESKQ